MSGMRYHPDDMLSLESEIERQGGAVLPDPCNPTMFQLRLPMGTGERQWTTVATAGCGFHARYVIPYERPDHKEGGGLMTACAVDDAMGMWPRFKHVVSDRSYLIGPTIPEEYCT